MYTGVYLAAIPVAYLCLQHSMTATVRAAATPMVKKRNFWRVSHKHALRVGF